MSWVWKADKPLRTQEECARIVHEVSLHRGLDQLATVLALMCIRQESDYWCPWNANDPESKNYPYDSQSDDGRSVGYFQQQRGPNGELWWGTVAEEMNLKQAADKFLTRLNDNYVTANDARTAGDFIQRVQRSGYPRAYDKHWDYCWSLLRRALANTPTPVVPTVPSPVKPPSIVPNPGWRGDPLYLPKLLEAFGVDVSTYTDSAGTPWDQRGHGDFDVIDYVVWHHTGSVNETDEGIAHHPALGLAATGLIHPNGHVTLTGSGIAWHAGDGIWPGVARGAMNQRSLGWECAYSWGPSEPNNPWPEAQVRAMINVGGAISWFLQDTLPPDHQIAHKEWAGADNPIHNYQGKPDPANFDMNWFRGQIAQRAAAGPTREVDDVPTVKRPSGSIYRESNDVLPWEGTEMDFVIDAQNHEARVERLAEQGDRRSLDLIKAVANGRSPVSDSLSIEDMAHARAVLDYINKTDS